MTLKMSIPNKVTKTPKFVAQMTSYDPKIDIRNRKKTPIETFKGIFSFGYMLLSLIGYLLSDWQDQMIVILLAPLLYIPIYLFLPTSIAWLFSSRKYDRAR